MELTLLFVFVQETDIGWHVNGLRKHPLGRSQEAGEVAHQVENMDKNVAKQKFFLFGICYLIILYFVGLGVACSLKGSGRR